MCALLMPPLSMVHHSSKNVLTSYICQLYLTHLKRPVRRCCTTRDNFSQWQCGSDHVEPECSIDFKPQLACVSYCVDCVLYCIDDHIFHVDLYIFLNKILWVFNPIGTLKNNRKDMLCFYVTTSFDMMYFPSSTDVIFGTKRITRQKSIDIWKT